MFKSYLLVPTFVAVIVTFPGISGSERGRDETGKFYDHLYVNSPFAGHLLTNRIYPRTCATVDRMALTMSSK